MDDLTMWSLIVGFLLPPPLAVVQQPTWSEPVRAFVTFLACLLVGAGTAYFQGDLTGRSFVSAALVVLVAAITTYKGFWEKTRIAPAIEAKTSYAKAA